MHNHLWLSLLLALFLTASGCAKHDDTGSNDMPAADSSSAPVAAPPAPSPATSAVSKEADAVQEADAAMEVDSPAPQKSDARGRAEEAKPKALRKKESGTAEEKVQPSGDDMERMD
jgi:hypothetical protein